LEATAVQGGCSYVGSNIATVNVESLCYSVETEPLSDFINACSDPNSQTAFRPETDDEAVSISLPFPVALYTSTPSINARISSNGWIAIGDGSINDPSGSDYINACPLPNYGVVQSDVIFAYWDDLLVSDTPVTGAKVCYATLSSTLGGRRFVVTFDSVRLFGNSVGVSSFSIVLYEGSNDVDVAYGTVAPNLNGGSASIGMQSSAVSQLGATVFSCNQASNVSLSNTLIRYTWLGPPSP
jgi:hypothetical protein